MTLPSSHCADDQLHFPAHQLERGRHHFHRHREGVILGDPKDKQVWLKAVDKIVCSVGEAGRTVIRTGLTGISPREPRRRPQLYCKTIATIPNYYLTIYAAGLNMHPRLALPCGEESMAGLAAVVA